MMAIALDAKAAAMLPEYRKRTHSMVREHILSQENTFYSKIALDATAAAMLPGQTF
jgi:hypothetical protein